MKESNPTFLEKRITDLEQKIEHLRFSRRVLMNLIDRIEKDKWELLSKFEKENKKLQVNNSKYAKTILNKNKQIMEMQLKLQNRRTSEN